MVHMNRVCLTALFNNVGSARKYRISGAKISSAKIKHDELIVRKIFAIHGINSTKKLTI